MHPDGGQYCNEYIMALPINIEDLLRCHKVESNRVEFKRGWNPASIYRTIVAFANDFDNLGGGYIVVGVEEEDGIAKRPVVGVPAERIDSIQRQMIGYNSLISPSYLPRVSVEEVDGRSIIVIWAPAGIDRPYSVRTDVTSHSDKREAFYIRSGTSSIQAKGETLTELRDLAARVPFDSRGNAGITEGDIDILLIRDYLQRVKSRLAVDVKNLDVMDILERLDLLSGPVERRVIKNVAAMMFSNTPERFFPYTQISVVVFPQGRTGNPNNFHEKTFRGSVPTIIRGTMQYLRDVVINEYVTKRQNRMEADKWFNYPYQALEEGVVNAMYHRDYQEHQEVEVSVEPDGIRILSLSGPDRSISSAALREGRCLYSRRYRNNRLGDFLKELGLTEGRCTGIPTMQQALERNGSPRATFETDDERSYFLLFIPVHEGCGNMAAWNEEAGRKYENDIISDTISDTIKHPQLSERQKDIIRLMKRYPFITGKLLTQKMSFSHSTISRDIQTLQKHNIIARKGGRKNGSWVVLLQNITNDKSTKV